jgi:hypothetical protein
VYSISPNKRINRLHSVHSAKTKIDINNCGLLQDRKKNSMASELKIADKIVGSYRIFDASPDRRWQKKLRIYCKFVQTLSEKDKPVRCVVDLCSADVDSDFRW